MGKCYVCFENKGEVPINAFKLLGASSKRNDSSKIGYFGTGLKYAIAVMLKQGIEFKVFSGEKEVKISTRKTKFIDENIDVMTVNGEKTSITLDAGIDWEPWFAIREIYSNTMDENGSMAVNQPLEAKAGHTRIFIDAEADALKDIFEHWNAYFAQNRPVRFKNLSGSIMDKLPAFPEFVVFRKGIRVYSNRRHSILDYDLNSLDINESRVAMYSWQVTERCSEMLAASDVDTIKKFLTLFKNPARNEYTEWQDSFWDMTATYTFSEAWLEALEEKRLVPANFAGHYDITETTLVLPDKLIDKLKARFGDAINTVGDNKDKFTIINNVDKQSLQKMLDVFEVAGFEWGVDKIDIVIFNDKDILGQAKDGRVLLSKNLFTPLYRHKVAPTLLEEIAHAQTGFSDCTRNMQDFLFSTITNLAKELAIKNDKL